MPHLDIEEKSNGSFNCGNSSSKLGSIGKYRTLAIRSLLYRDKFAKLTSKFKLLGGIMCVRSTPSENCLKPISSNIYCRFKRAVCVVYADQCLRKQKIRIFQNSPSVRFCACSVEIVYYREEISLFIDAFRSIRIQFASSKNIVVVLNI